MPKAMRDELGLRGGDTLEITVHDRVIEIDVPHASIHLEERQGVPVGIPDDELPILTNDDVRSALERSRR